MIIVGIDPGIKGAIASYKDGVFSHVSDMPTFQVKSGKSKKNFVDPYGLVSIIKEHAPDIIYLEKVHAMPGQGVTSMFNFGMGYGIILGVVASLKIPIEHVTPQKWKKSMNCPAGKDEARKRASELIPDNGGFWPLKKHDGRAEAALIALYGSRII